MGILGDIGGAKTKLTNSVGGLVGLGGGQGEYYQAAPFQSAAQGSIDTNIKNLSDPKTNDIIAAYSQGKMSLSDAMSQLHDSSANTSAAYGQLATSPLAGSMVASEQVRNDPLSSGLLGEGGALDRSLAEEKDLSSRGYSLQPEDYEAYGQGSGNIARMFGTQEQSLSQSLANRGLSAAGSGVANQQFSGLQGNKFEQLGQLQRQIADDRMTKNMQRLEQTRNFASSLGTLGQNALNSQYNRNLSGVENEQNMLSSAAGQDISRYSAVSAAQQAEEKSRKENEKASLSDALGKGVYSGVQGGISSGLGYATGTGIGGSGYKQPDILNNKKTGVI